MSKNIQKLFSADLEKISAGGAIQILANEINNIYQMKKLS